MRGSLAFTATLLEYLTLRVSGLKHRSASIRYAALSQNIRFLLEIQHSHFCICIGRVKFPLALISVISAGLVFLAIWVILPRMLDVTSHGQMRWPCTPIDPEDTRTASSDPIPRHY